MNKKSTRNNLSGLRFGLLIVKSYLKTVNKIAIWECLCDCGKTHFVDSKHLRIGGTKSCGCLKTTRVNHKKITIQDRFEKYIFYSPCGCHYWIGASTGAYSVKHRRGTIRIGRKSMSTSRIAYELYKGQISDGLSVCHTCDNPLCVNPDHLFLGTHYENMIDMAKKGKNASKITLDDVGTIRGLKGKMPHREIAEKFGVSRVTVTRILNGKSRNHV